MNTQAPLRLSEIQATEFISANKFLADTIKTVYGPGHQISFSKIHRRQYGTISVGPDAPDAEPILADPFEFDIDPFVNDFDNTTDDDEVDNDDDVQSTNNSVHSADSVLVPIRPRLEITSELSSQNQHTRNDINSEEIDENTEEK